ncbi:unnamed protein product, partial [Mesorhabditis belari]|uniref:Uncharacterized protein n=1 Tax=Mesorhabditis belari TaxID=2138241 RepID=A0AAF3EY74_9BILA
MSLISRRILGFVRSGHLTSLSGISTSKTIIEKPTKETLFRIEWIFDDQLPRLFKTGSGTLFNSFSRDVEYEDKLAGKRVVGRDNLASKLAQARFYYRFVSPFVKLEKVGSYFYENENALTFLWKLTTMESSFLSWFPFAPRKQTLRTQEGVLDIYISENGLITRMVNRKMTCADKTAAIEMKNLMADAEETRNLSIKSNRI